VVVCKSVETVHTHVPIGFGFCTRKVVLYLAFHPFTHSNFHLLLFCSLIAKLFLNIRHELGDRKAAPRSLAMSLAAFGTFYLIVVLAAGSNPPAFLFDAIPAGTLNRRIAGLLLWAHVAVSYAINSQAICSSMDRLIGYRDTTDTPSMSSSQRWLLLTCLMAAAAYTVANAIPFFQDLVALIGAITSVPLTLLLPAVFWRKYMAVPIWKPTRDSLYSYSLLVFAVVFMVAATVGSVYSIQQDWSAHGPPFSCH
jgi:amino acid permease